MDTSEHLESTQSTISVALKADLSRSDMVRGLVRFVNYAAIDPTCVSSDDLDLHGKAMLPADLTLFAHRWLAFSRSIDIQHDGIGRPVYAVESFMNSPEIASPAYPINSHVVLLDVQGSKEAFDGLKSGKLNSVSLDALTFNRKIRVKVKPGQTKCAADGSLSWVRPTTLAQWAHEIAEDGWDGVVGINRISDDLYVAMRSSGMPLAVQLFDDGMDVTAAPSGAWSEIGARVFTSPSLISSRRQEVDLGSYSGPVLEGSLKAAGAGLDGRLVADAPGFVEAEMFAAIEDGVGRIPHHVIDGGRMMVSRDAVIRGLSSISSLPENLRTEARDHLMRHMEDIGGGR